MNVHLNYQHQWWYISVCMRESECRHHKSHTRKTSSSLLSLVLCFTQHTRCHRIRFCYICSRCETSEACISPWDVASHRNSAVIWKHHFDISPFILSISIYLIMANYFYTIRYRRLVEVLKHSQQHNKFAAADSKCARINWRWKQVERSTHNNNNINYPFELHIIFKWELRILYPKLISG